jgi:hypothetical protein
MPWMLPTAGPEFPPCIRPEPLQADPTSGRRWAGIRKSGGPSWLQRHTTHIQGLQKGMRSRERGVHSRIGPDQKEGTIQSREALCIRLSSQKT